MQDTPSNHHGPASPYQRICRFSQYRLPGSDCSSKTKWERRQPYRKAASPPCPFGRSRSGALAPRLTTRRAAVAARIRRARSEISRAARQGHRFLVGCLLENRLRHSEGARVKLKKSITGWLRRHGVTDPIVLVGRENSRKHGEHSHWIIACPPHLVAALVEHVQKALLRIDQRDALPPRTWWWTRPTVVPVSYTHLRAHET